MSVIECKFRIEDVPSPPAVALKLLELFKDSDFEMDDIVNVIQIDPGLTARLIAYCNSPMIGSPRKVESLNRAIMVLGTNAVRMLSLSFSLVEIGDSKSDFDFRLFWKRSLAMAVSLQTVARYANMDPDEKFLVGLMSNIGEIAIYQNDIDAHTASLDAAESVASVVRFEQDRFGTNRFDVAAEVLKAWHFPASVSDSVQKVSGADTTENGFVELAWQLGTILTSAAPDVSAIERCKACLEQSLQLDEQQQEELFAKATESWSEFAQLLQFENKLESTSLREIEMAARMKMTEVSILQIHEQERVESENEALRSTIGKDILTGANNRRAYEEHASQALSRCRRAEKPFSLLVIDIDRFKLCNDAYGHQVGDEALKHVANTLASKLRDYDNLYRYGGEEFVIILPECQAEHSMIVAERVRQGVEESPLVSDDLSIPLTVSIGIVSTAALHAHSLDELFALADECLYKAKSQGRNCCVLNDEASQTLSLS